MVGILDRLAAGFSVRTTASDSSSESEKAKEPRVSFAPSESKLNLSVNNDAVVTDFSAEASEESSESAGVLDSVQNSIAPKLDSPLDRANSLREKERSAVEESKEREAPEANRTPRKNLGNTPQAQVDRNSGFDRRNQNFSAPRQAPSSAPGLGETPPSRPERVALEIQRDIESTNPEAAASPEQQAASAPPAPEAAVRIERAVAEVVGRTQNAAQIVAELDKTIEAAASATGGVRAAEVAAVVEETEITIQEGNRNSIIENDLSQYSQVKETAAKQLESNSANPAKAASKLNTTA